MGRSTVEAVRKLRTAMKREKLFAYIVPSEDSHQSEYIAACDKRRAWVTGFSGSRGLAALTHDKAAMWTDGRYFQQAEAEMEAHWSLMKERVDGTPKLEAWLIQEASGVANARVGVDPTLVSTSYFNSLSKHLQRQQISLVVVPSNLVDEVWGAERPARPQSSLTHLTVNECGRAYQDKIASLRSQMKQKQCRALVVSALDEVAWTLNLRGADIEYNPVFFAYLLILEDEVRLFCDAGEREGFAALAKEAIPDVALSAYDQALPYLKERLSGLEGGVWVPGESSSYAVASSVAEERWVTEPSPVASAKALKNDVELAGFEEAHRKDGVAHAEFLCWLEGEMGAGRAVDELSAAAKFLQLRQAQHGFVDLSFPTIAAAGPHASSCHYGPTAESNRRLSAKEVFLCDSGAQYRQGTTDVTRTVAFEEQAEFVKEAYTRVLKCHIRLAALKFPVGTPGVQLDAVARLDLWEAGLEFRHGVGHGVGHFLNVHEGPMGIGNRDPATSKEGMRERMVLTIEPGYYEDGAFGIRIENVCHLVKAHTSHNFQDVEFLGFRALTLVPIATNLIVKSLMTSSEVEWLNGYHARVLAELSPVLKLQGKSHVITWLTNACQPFLL